MSCSDVLVYVGVMVAVIMVVPAYLESFLMNALNAGIVSSRVLRWNLLLVLIFVVMSAVAVVFFAKTSEEMTLGMKLVIVFPVMWLVVMMFKVFLYFDWLIRLRYGVGGWNDREEGS